jgi:glycosyltransferase involved in cell wall biosynthesis
MRVALIADAYKPARTSVAVQMHDLAHEIAARGHRPTLIVPMSGLQSRWELTTDGKVEVLRVRAPRTKDISDIRRAVSEFFLPYAMQRSIAASPLSNTRWDGIVWYSPTIFFGPLVKRLKKRSRCRAYLILRDLFPDWAADTGVMRKGVRYAFLKLVQQYQYFAADVIGVQSPGNLGRVKCWLKRPVPRIEVLYNWLAIAPIGDMPQFMETTQLRGRKLFVYLGNMGRAQDLDAVLSLAQRTLTNRDIGFLLVGRGTDVERLRVKAKSLELDNLEFYDEVEPGLVPGLLSKCDVGIVALDLRHKTHNIPGKFLTYVQSGLPVLARINHRNDLEDLIKDHRLGRVCTTDSIDDFEKAALDLLNDKAARADASLSGTKLAKSLFSVRSAASQILRNLSDESKRG